MEFLKIRSGTIKNKIARKDNSIIERCVSTTGQISITHYEVIKEFNKYSLVKCLLDTGRTHQIRVHMAYIGHPLLGDSLYNKKDNLTSLISRQALHNYRMEFIHPVNKTKILLEAEIPEDIKKLII